MNSVLMMTPIAMVATIAINLVSSVSGQPAFIISNPASPDHSIVTTLPARPWYGHNPASPDHGMVTTLLGQITVWTQPKVFLLPTYNTYQAKPYRQKQKYGFQLELNISS